MQTFIHSLFIACSFGFVAPLNAANIPDLFLHDGLSLNGEWKSIIDPYETGFYDYRWEQRDSGPNPSRSEASSSTVKPENPGERVEYDFDTSPSLQVPGDWNTQRPELLYYEGTLWYRKTFESAGVAMGNAHSCGLAR
jgi:beta-glucuronidase